MKFIYEHRLFFKTKTSIIFFKNECNFIYYTCYVLQMVCYKIIHNNKRKPLSQELDFRNIQTRKLIYEISDFVGYSEVM